MRMPTENCLTIKQKQLKTGTETETETETATATNTKPHHNNNPAGQSAHNGPREVARALLRAGYLQKFR